MNTKHETATLQDRELARRFRQMRREDAARLPDIPCEEELAARRPLASNDRQYVTPVRVAAAITVVVVCGVLMLTSAPPDPGVLYADIMAANPITTDQLLSASPGTLPEMIDTVGVDEFDLRLGPATQIN
jgi:hypothetical protein